MTANPNSVTTTPNEWKVTFHDQSGYDLKLQLADNWGFDTSSSSSITLTLNGTNYNPHEGDLLLVFAISDSYFGIVIRNELSSQLYKAYPEPTTSTLRSVPHIESTMLSPSTPDRWDRICESTTWFNTVPLYMNPTHSASEWPLKMTITNDPVRDTLTFSQRDPSSPAPSSSPSPSDDELYTASYLSSFDAHRGMTVYLMTDGVTESFGLYSVDIELQCFECSALSGLYPVPQPPPTTPPIAITVYDALNGSHSNDSNHSVGMSEVNGIYNTVYSLSGAHHGEDARMASIIMGVIGGILCLCVGLLMHCCFLSQRRDSYDFAHRPNATPKSKEKRKHRKYSGMRTDRREHDFIPTGKPVDLGIVNGTSSRVQIIRNEQYHPNSVNARGQRQDERLRKHLDLNRHRAVPVLQCDEDDIIGHLDIESVRSALSSVTPEDESGVIVTASDHKVGRDLIKEGERMTTEAMKQLFRNSNGRRDHREYRPHHHRNRSAMSPVMKPLTMSSRVVAQYRNRGQSVDRMQSQVSTTTSMMVRGRTESGRSSVTEHAHFLQLHGQHPLQNSMTPNTVILHENVSSINSVDYHKLRQFLDHLDDDGHDQGMQQIHKEVGHDNSDAQSNQQDLSTSSEERILEKSETRPLRLDL